MLRCLVRRCPLVFPAILLYTQSLALVGCFEWYDAAVSSTTVPAGALLIAGTML